MKAMWCCLGAAAVGLMAVSAADAYTIRGIGTDTCADYNANVNGWNGYRETWVVGFVTGAESARHPVSHENSPFPGVSNDDVIGFVTAFCSRYPMKNLAAAADASAIALNSGAVARGQ